MSKLKPFSCNCLARPPGVLFFSMTVTFQPSLAIKEAADNPAKPLPITITDFSATEKILITADMLF